MSPMALNFDAIMRNGSFHGDSADWSGFLCRYLGMADPTKDHIHAPPCLEPISTSSLPTHHVLGVSEGLRIGKRWHLDEALTQTDPLRSWSAATKLDRKAATSNT